MGRDRVLACAARLIELGLFRVGGEAYADQNGSYGLATVRKGHVRARGDELRFDYPAKSGNRRVVTIADPAVAAVVRRLKARRGGGPELLAYKDDRGRWVDVRSDDINAYLEEALGRGFSAKDFRTWAATVLAAVALAVEDDGDRPDRAVVRVVRDVARQLGNTPAVARGSYVDPRVVEQFEQGETVGDAVDEALHGIADREGDEVPRDLLAEIEAAVVDLVERAPRR
jgi:DNA topoisomerase IB